MKRTQFVIQSLDHALQREFAGGIETEIGHSHHSEERTDRDYLAVPLPTHDREDRLEHAEYTEDIGFKLCPRIFQAVLFERTSLGKASIVHQQIDAPGTLQDRLYACLNGCLRTDIQRKQFKAASSAVRKSATGAKHLKTLRYQKGCGGLAKAGRGPGDKRDS